MKIDEQSRGNAEPYARQEMKGTYRGGGIGTTPVSTACPQKKTAEGRNFLRVNLESESDD